ncbi:MAG: hypothetical protein VBE63_00615 [Lamprobacter sp.]|uniref:hypothetical protein n=1 Tax=Lamprobacter sp. TaxID=3100796 RepID=UPI002B25C736|nr:hypothetical protein [Lamprobacter sp.]MEA3638426.1 hypothetical protein [Lamprobacter sp.]
MAGVEIAANGCEPSKKKPIAYAQTECAQGKVFGGILQSRRCTSSSEHRFIDAVADRLKLV